MDIPSLVQSQRAFFQTGITLDISYRLGVLELLREAILRHEQEIQEALQADLGKGPMESYLCETGMVLSELRHTLKHLPSWAKDRRFPTPLAQFPSRSFVKSCPYGNVLILSPWNYPFLLTVGPLVTALAAGNTAIVKPSAYSPHTTALIRKILEECFLPEFVAVVPGGRAENSQLLQEKFDFIFFTGSQAVGREVLRCAAPHLTPAVLELGGKSPCIVDATADIPLAARRIVFGKFLNCGQTCVAPDYILCDEAIKAPLVTALEEEIRRQFGENPLKNPDYGKIVNEKHFARLQKLGQNPVCCRETLQIAPTVLSNATWECEAMQEEIFGPILPVLTYREFEEIFPLLQDKPLPLALYFFSRSKRHIRAVTTRLRYGGGCINDVIIHLATSHMGFGGVGESGMGAYHGKVGFDTFSHQKSIVHKGNWLDLPMRYQPYTGAHSRLVKKFLK